MIRCLTILEQDGAKKMETENFGLYSIEINGIKLYSADPNEFLIIAKEYERLGCDSVIIRYPNGEVMYGGRWEDV